MTSNNLEVNPHTKEKDASSTVSSGLAPTIACKELNRTSVYDEKPIEVVSRLSEKFPDHRESSNRSQRRTSASVEKVRKHDGEANQNHESQKLSSNINRSDPFDEAAVLGDIVVEDDPKMPIITFRSVLTGLIMTGFGSGVSQLFMYKPVHLNLHPLFIQLACLTIAQSFSAIPGPKWWNPCPVTVKETVFSSIMSTAGSAGTLSVETIATQDLFFSKKMSPAVIMSTLMSTQLLGYAWASVLRPVLIYPARTIFPSVLPSVALFNSMSGDTPEVRAQVSFFKKAFLGISLYEVIPNYIAPALQAISVWCLTLPPSPSVTQLFGGSMVAEGMGFLSLCLDWTVVGSHGPLFVPLLAQITDWVACFFAIFLMSAAYRYNWFDGKSLPFISFDLLDHTGEKYNLTTAVYPNGTENVEGVQALGLPYYATAFVLGKAGVSLALSSAISGAIFYNWAELKSFFKKDGQSEGEDPHRTIAKRYREFPNYGFAALAVITLVLAFVSLHFGESGLTVFGLIIAFFLSALFSLAAGFFYGTVGIHLHCHAVVQMLGGIFFPGNAIANMWFSMYGSTTVSQCTFMLKDLKLGQYMHLSSFSVVTAQITGTVLGAFIHWVVMESIVNSQRDVLLLPHGNGVFTGMHLSSLSAQATSWGIFSQRLYFAGARYSIIPFCLVIGFFLPLPFFLLHRWKPSVGWDRVNVSLFCASVFHAILGVTSGRTTAIILAIYTQYYIRKYKFQWYQKYNYVLSAAFDGGTQMAVFVLSFALQGGAGFKINMPTYFLNPEGTRDYCYLNTTGKSHH